MSEQDKPKNKQILVYLIATLLALGVTVILVIELFNHTMRREIAQKVLERPGTEIRKLRVHEGERLSRYQWASQEDGIVRLPLDRAVELTLRDWEKRPSVPPQPASDVAAPDQAASTTHGTPPAPPAPSGTSR